MPKSCIPGYDEALREERRLREEIYLGVPHDICGVKINQVTPLLLARLLRMETPFMGSGEITPDEVMRFLWAMSVDFSTDTEKRREFIENAAKRLAGNFEEAESEIDAFLNATFMDAPTGGGDSVPYVTGIAWMIYTMVKDPFRWDKDRTLNTPLREIYQYTRCMKLDKGAVLYNPSDKIKADWLKDVAKSRGGNN